MTLAETQAGIDARLSHARRFIPIIVVPGIMGSRLKTIDGDMVWDPQIGLSSVPAMDCDTLAQIHLPLFAADEEISEDRYQRTLEEAQHWETHDTRTGEPRTARPEMRETVCGYHVRHWGAPINDFYGQLIQRLYYELPPFLPPDVMPKIYCCGYDWRQSNAVSSRELATVVAEAEAECPGEQVIIIAHSMGGLVARHYCRHRGGEAKLRALFLVGSPSLGAPKPYLLLKRGIPDMDVRYAVVGWSLSEARSREICRTMPSGFELAPSPLYCSHVDPGFAIFEPSGTAYPATGPLEPGRSFRDASNFQRFYDDIYTGVPDLPNDRGDVTLLMHSAIAFHQGLMVDGKAYMPPNTHCLYARDLPTVVRLEFPLEGRLHYPDGDYNFVQTSPTIAYENHHGDTAVPANSANPDPSFLSRPFVEVGELPGVEHVAMCNARGAYSFIKRRICAML